MNTNKRMIQFVLHGAADKFKTVLKEEITNRITDLLENLYLEKAKTLLYSEPNTEQTPTKIQKIEEINKFYPENVYHLKDGNTILLDKIERDLISKLYENLNNDNKERMLKLLTETQESFNRVLKLAKLEEKRKNNE